METSKYIIKELMDLSMVVANIGNQNVFTVPEGYFDTLGSDILSQIFISALPKQIPYSRPSENYFNNLASEVLLKMETLKGNNTSENEESILNKISKETLSSVLSSVPSGYFDTLADKILQKIKSEASTRQTEIEKELAEISPLLSTISKANVYAVPDNYFEKINIPVSESKKEKQTGKVILLQSRMRKAVSYAAAASVAAIMLFAGYQFFYSKNNKNTNHNITLINNAYYDSLKNVNIEKELASLSDEEINAYLDSERMAFINVSESPVPEVSDIQSFLHNASDEEILQYLKQNKEPGEKTFKGI
ncbi:MAG: hypothetical protein ABJA79_09075 [Parafilimonas sp.]